jgi:pyrimidine deaminase RibD-like protein
VTSPHPNAGCLLFSANGQLVGSGCQRAQGSTPSEVLAAAAAREAARGATAYLNLETGDCHGEEASVAALVQAGVSRVVVGLRHPLAHLRWVCAGEARWWVDVAGMCVCVGGGGNRAFGGTNMDRLVSWQQAAVGAHWCVWFTSEEASVAALVQAGVSRVVVGLRHPLAHLRCVGPCQRGSVVGGLGESLGVHECGCVSAESC